jgi:uncharacterized membrane protein
MKTSSKAVIWIVVVFLTGALFGSALTFVIYQPHKPPWADRKTRQNKSPDEFVQLMSDKLKLNEQQRNQLRTMMIETRDQFRNQFKETQQEIRIETRKRLQSILSPDQLKLWDEELAKAPSHHPFARGRRSKR